MIKHIVCFKLNNNADCEKKKARDLLLSMKGRVPQIIDIEVGCDFLGSARSYDVILQVKLENEEMLSEYQKDEYHVNVVKTYMRENAATSVAIDYVID